MTSLDEKASDGRDVVRASECENQLYRLQTTELKPADDVGTDDFPQYGDFADVQAVGQDGDALGPRWLETPGDLARELLDADIGAGDCFVVLEAAKTDDAAWTFDAEKRGLGDA